MSAFRLKAELGWRGPGGPLIATSGHSAPHLARSAPSHNRAHEFSTSWERGHASVVDLLIKAGAAIDLKDKDGKTAHDLARDAGNAEVLRTLDGAGAG